MQCTLESLLYMPFLRKEILINESTAASVKSLKLYDMKQLNLALLDLALVLSINYCAKSGKWSTVIVANKSLKSIKNLMAAAEKLSVALQALLSLLQLPIASVIVQS